MQERASSNLIDIHRSFARTEHGQRLEGNVRYGKYKPESVSNERWRELLGADVNNLTHMPLTYGLATSFILHMEKSSPQTLSDQDKAVLRVAALVHDWAEAIVGDISYDDKTSEDEQEEHRQFTKNLAGFYDGDEETFALIRTAVEEVVFDPESRLGRMFNAIERVGYIRTALRASEHVKNGTAQDCESGFRWIAADVLSNQVVRLTELAEEYPPVKKYLLAQQEQISDAYQVIDAETYTNYGEQADEKREQVERGRGVWDEWLATDALVDSSDKKNGPMQVEVDSRTFTALEAAAQQRHQKPFGELTLPEVLKLVGDSIVALPSVVKNAQIKDGDRVVVSVEQDGEEAVEAYARRVAHEISEFDPEHAAQLNVDVLAPLSLWRYICRMNPGVRDRFSFSYEPPRDSE